MVEMTQEQMTTILEQIGALVATRAKKLCPVNDGHLRASIKWRIEGDSVIVYSDLDYAKDMEYGTPPEPLSETEKEDIGLWAVRHGASPGSIIRSIEKKGIKVGTPENPLHITSFGRDSYRPFLRPAVLQSRADMRKIVRKVMGE